MQVSRWIEEDWRQAIQVYPRNLTLVSSLISRMSFCPPPSRILCLSRLTSSSSSFKGGSFAFTGLRRNIFKKKNQTFQLLSKATFMSLKQPYQAHLPPFLGLTELGTEDAHNRRTPLTVWAQLSAATQDMFPLGPHPVTARVLGKSSPGPDEKPVLDQNSNEEEHHPFHGHGKKVSSYQVPREWRHKAILPCETQCRHLVRGRHQKSWPYFLFLK